MKSRTLILLIVAGGCGLVAMLGIQQVLNKKGEDNTRKVKVLQAAVDIGLGERLSETNTRFVMVDIENVPEGAVTGLEQIADRSVLIPVNIGDWVTKKKLSEAGDQGVSVRIPSGMQVATIPVDATTSHSGMLQPGHRVDLMISYQDKNELGEQIQKVRRILQYVEVFAVDNKVYGLNDDNRSDKAKNISLLVSPEQALFLELAKTQGRMSTVLRGNGDDAEVVEDELSADELIGRPLPGVSVASARDTNQRSGFDAGAEQESTDSLLNDLQVEFGGPEAGVAVSVTEDTWKIAIWQGTDVRVDTVNLHSDTPVATNTNESVSATPGQRNVQVPVPSDAPATGGRAGMKGLEEASLDLSSLFEE